MLVMCLIEMGVLHSLFVPILSFVISRVFVLLLLDSSEVILRVGTNFQVLRLLFGFRLRRRLERWALAQTNN